MRSLCRVGYIGVLRTRCEASVGLCESLLFGLNEVGDRMVIADSLCCGDRVVESFHSCFLSTLEQGDGAFHVATLGCEDATCIVGERRVAGLEEMALGLVELTLLQLDVGSVEVEHRVVGVYFDRFHEYIAVLMRAFGVRLCKGVEVDGAESRGVGGICTLDVGQRSVDLDGVLHVVVGVAQPGVYLLKDKAVILGVACLYSQILVVEAEGTVDDLEDFGTVAYVELHGVGDVAA